MKDVIKRGACGLLLTGSMLLLSACAQQSANEPSVAPAAAVVDQQVFETPEAAIQAVHGLIGTGDLAAIERVFGAGSVDTIYSGDPQHDRENAQLIKQMIDAGVAFESPDEATRVALLGQERWPLAVPLVRTDAGWRFDIEAGREELLNRRIGNNELTTLSTLHEIVDAQREYAQEGRDGNPPAYAARFVSTEGKRDGLYWPLVDGEPLSPLGDLLAESEYRGRERVPYHGYYYRILTAQGPSAPGGARSYLDEAGRLTYGYAVIAWPAKYGNSGVMSFLMNHRGIVFQKDLGPDTEAIATKIDAYDPDLTWVPTADHLTLEQAAAPAW